MKSEVILSRFLSSNFISRKDGREANPLGQRRKDVYPALIATWYQKSNQGFALALGFKN